DSQLATLAQAPLRLALPLLAFGRSSDRLGLASRLTFFVVLRVSDFFTTRGAAVDFFAPSRVRVCPIRIRFGSFRWLIRASSCQSAPLACAISERVSPALTW